LETRLEITACPNFVTGHDRGASEILVNTDPGLRTGSTKSSIR